MSFFTYYNNSVATLEKVVPQEAPPKETLQPQSSPLNELRTPQLDEAPVDPGQARSSRKQPDGPVTGSVSIDGTWDPLKVYLREACDHPLLTRQEEDDLAALVQQGDLAARERMIVSNLRLVVKIAREFDELGVPLLDLINMGNIGLMTAVTKFEPDRGAKFSTYAIWWIRQGILRGLCNEARTIRIPAYKIQQLYRLRRAKEHLDTELGREATDEELAAEAEVPVRQIRQILSLSKTTLSLDAPVGYDGDETISSTVSDDTSKIPSALTECSDLQRRVRLYVDKLGEKERVILTRRFGLDGKNPETLEEIGADYHVTRERIRQIEARALVKLKRLALGSDV